MQLCLVLLGCSIDLYIGPFLCQYHFVSITTVYSLKSAMLIPPALFFLLSIAFAIQGTWWHHMNTRIFSIIIKSILEILAGIALNL